MLWLNLRRVGESPSRFKAAGDDSYGGHFYDVQTQVNAVAARSAASNSQAPRRRGEGLVVAGGGGPPRSLYAIADDLKQSLPPTRVPGMSTEGTLARARAHGSTKSRD